MGVGVLSSGHPNLLGLKKKRILVPPETELTANCTNPGEVLHEETTDRHLWIGLFHCPHLPEQIVTRITGTLSSRQVVLIPGANAGNQSHRWGVSLSFLTCRVWQCERISALLAEQS